MSQSAEILPPEVILRSVANKCEMYWRDGAQEMHTKGQAATWDSNLRKALEVIVQVPEQLYLAERYGYPVSLETLREALAFSHKAKELLEQTKPPASPFAMERLVNPYMGSKYNPLLNWRPKTDDS